MSGNNFEKQAQNKMEELQFIPSQQVWQNVEKELRKEKKRRRWLLLPLLLLGVLAGGYFIFNGKDAAGLISSKNTPVAAPKNNTVNEPSIVNQPKASALKQQQIAVSESENKTNSITNTQPKNSDALSASGLVTEGVNNGSSVGQSTNDKEAGFPEQDEKLKFPGKSRKRKLVIAESSNSMGKNNDEKEQVSTFQSLVKKADAEKNSDKAEIMADVNSDGSLSETAQATTKQPENPAAKEATIRKDSMEEVPSSMHTTDSVLKLAVVIKQADKKNKWKWFGNIEMGIANLNNSFAPLGALGISGASEAAKSATASTSVSLQTNSSPFQLSSPPPANPRPGFSFGAGVRAARNISRRSSITIGISYAFLSTRGSSGEVANVNNGGANFSGILNDLINNRQYYLNTSNKEFGNEYHFLQLPISFTTLVGHNKRLPWYWNTGISVNYLLTSNALVYDNTNRVYYKDNDIFRPLQLGWHTGIEAEFFSRKAHPLRLGPQFSFNFSQLLKNPSGDKQRFAYAGIRAGIQLNKK
jgi:hypothetical protein